MKKKISNDSNWFWLELKELFCCFCNTFPTNDERSSNDENIII